MNITLTWDLFIIVFFAVIVTYSFIIGMKESVKVIIATYVAIVAVQGVGNLIGRFMGTSTPTTNYLEQMGLSLDLTMLSSVKLILLIATIVFLSIKAGFEVEYAKEGSQLQSAALTGVVGFATAGLLLSTILTYIAGLPLLDSTLSQTQTISSVMQQSQLMQAMILYQEVWFSLPAFLLIGVGFLNNR